MPAELLVQLPEELRAFYRESGYHPTTVSEHRSNARLRVRREAEIRFIFTPPALLAWADLPNRDTGRVLIKDLSKTGIGILYHQQIYPEERIQVAFQGRLIHAVAVRCRHLADACFETGAIIQLIEAVSEV